METQSNGYFRPTNEIVDEVPNGALLLDLVNTVARKAIKDGFVDQADLIVGSKDYMRSSVIRSLFTRNYSWLVPNRVWVSSMCCYIVDNDIHSVLEVAGGTGFVGKLITRYLQRYNPGYDFQWICTDEDPPTKTFGSVEKLSAEEAVNKYPDAEMLFFGWWPYEGDRGDLDSSKAFVNSSKPVIVVGEGYGGCTGSREFWEAAAGRYWSDDMDKEGKLPELSVEYVGWGLESFDGIHDTTYLVTERKINGN